MGTPARLRLCGGKNLFKRLPKSQGAIANSDGRRMSQAARLHITEQLPPALRALANADLEADQLFFSSGVAAMTTSMHSA